MISVPCSACQPQRTLTNLYNARPTGLANAHAALDRAVWTAYGWTDDPAETTEDQILERLLRFNLERSATLMANTESTAEIP